ncbi:MAG: hypothetical protein ABR571_10130 [Jatrophihabitans sp.]|uniref:hypothetical protein n=1 Tax=Jatrophihabitans sp. TaxID=1932789 RepID=UPI00390FF882
MLDNALAAARGNAAQAVAIARNHGWTVPDHYGIAEAIYTEAVRLQQTEQPVMPTITQPKAAEKALCTYAAEAGQHTAFIEAAAALEQHAATDQTIQIRSALPEWVANLAAELAEAASDFLAAHALAPAGELSGYEDDEQTAAFMKARRCAALLDRLAAERVIIGTGIGEPRMTNALLWVVLEPPVADDVTADHVRMLGEMWREYSDRVFRSMTAVARWQRLASLGTLSLPPLFGLEDRENAWNQLRNGHGSAQLTANGNAARQLEDRARAAAMLQKRVDAEQENRDNTARVLREREMAANAAGK